TRPRWLLAAAAAAAALVVVGVIALRGGGPVGTVHTAGKELLVDGEVAAAGQPVREGAWVEARRGDSTLLLAGKRGVLLREGARARFEDGGAWAVLEAGRARFSVRPGLGPFTVAAGEARIEVRGTVFVVERRADGETLVAVHRGEVRVAGSGAAVTLGEGQETTVARGGVPTPARAVRPGSLEEDRGGDLLELLRRAWQSLVRSLDAEVGP
ncbi:MAG: FecR domain-containing protein, partial [Deltaproteobacteria bacterium]|nr:FecR domain-containing protein [Deltaproteobacteria bacterium]